MNRILLMLLLALPLSLMAQSTSSKSDQSLKGTASFYGNQFNGAKTATGEIFKQKNFTAASNNFKFHSWVKVTNLENNKSVIVRINDRMHPKSAQKGRVVDLTKAAAQQLGIGLKGLVKVLVELVPDDEIL